ncbi:TldD/PmbA family protein [Vulgatibacter incomptus]|uniref:TldD-domain protein n=1 Tax=Vulgatibacter incomptus TaxID=1391653 RepID=A0A0K1PB73_9BACT|nr:metallopeptidase TldD-related protein [Vulgatibacter incomptus]AKU90671.1 TldD-domain protein [Vulgatibacter incomptus]
MFPRTIAALATILALFAAVPAARAADGAATIKKDGRLVMLEAMKGELTRSMAKLELAGHDAPYFISYRIVDQSSHGIVARYGALFDDRSQREAKIHVDVRVGSYERDSSEGVDDGPFFLGDGGGPSYLASPDAPLTPDPDALHNALWLLTDQKYKAALSAWLKNKAQSVYALEDDDRGDSFTREAPARFVQDRVAFDFDRARWGEVAKGLSAHFRETPEIFDSEVRVTADKIVRLQVNSEGTELVTEETLFAVHVQAYTRAVDGQLLDNSRDFYAGLEGQLPSPQVMKKETAAMVAELMALRTAPVIDPFTGPAILAPEATGVLFHEAVGHRLEGERQQDDNEGRTFKGQIGRAVLPAFLTVVDDPTRQNFETTALNGFYRYDDQGVAAQKAVLFENGVLKSFLLSRRPVKGFTHSNGHGRAQANRAPMARMANLIVTSTNRMPYAKLRARLIAEAKKAGKPYALIIRDITGGNTNTSGYGYQAFKGVPRLVYRVDVATGKEELVRGVEIVGTPLTSINKIVATGDEFGVFNGFCGAESGYVPVSTVAPAALITELELQRTVNANQRSPLIPGPWAKSAADR